LGDVFGVFVMCLLQINRIKDYEDKIVRFESYDKKIEHPEIIIHIPRID
jgi:hypothetical protein